MRDSSERRGTKGEGGPWFAHSKGFSGKEQTQREHLSEVERLATIRCPPSLLNDVRLAAFLHDFGKYSPLFKRRIQGLESGLDHWTPGAHPLLKYGLSGLAGIAVHGHHWVSVPGPKSQC